MKYFINKKCTEIVICMKDPNDIDELENNIPRIIIHFDKEYRQRIRINFDMSMPLELNNLKYLINEKIESIDLLKFNIIKFNISKDDFFAINITPTSIIYGTNEPGEGKIIFNREENKTDE